VAEFDYHDVSRDEQGGDGGEAAFVRVAAGGAAADGFVYYGGAFDEVGFEVGAPACVVLVWGDLRLSWDGGGLFLTNRR
jgi:hypothetical protein